jgi:hypothetical protein
VAPYSGVLVPFAAFANMNSWPRNLEIRVEVEDLFGKEYRLELRVENTRGS